MCVCVFRLDRVLCTEEKRKRTKQATRDKEEEEEGEEDG